MELKSRSRVLSLFRYYASNVSKVREIKESNEFLAIEAKKGNKDAMNKLMEKNSKLIIKFAADFNINGDMFLDLIQEGYLALYEAVRNFDISKNTKFSTYASFWIRQRMSTFVKKSKEGCYYEVCVNSSDEKNSYENIFCKVLNFCDMDLEEDYKFEDSLESEFDIQKIIMETDLSNLLNAKLSKLGPKEKFIIERRFGLNNKDQMSLTEIAKIFNVSPECIRYIERKAIDKLRNMLESYMNY